MPVDYKASGSTKPIFATIKDTVGQFLKQRASWFKVGQREVIERLPAVCPHCAKPVQLRGLHKQISQGSHADGYHPGAPVTVFIFDQVLTEFCPYPANQASQSPKSQPTESTNAASVQKGDYRCTGL